MVKSILDTDILSEYLKGHDPNVVRHATRYAQEHGVFTFTSVTVHEIVYGLELKSASSQLSKALDWLQQNEEIMPTSADYLTAAMIKATARKQGSALELPDCSGSNSVAEATCHRQHRGLPGNSSYRRISVA